ncbi:MAG: hypothetical protein A3F84_20525 [Candidatus Handelsmanbacteria bacterium RIFCSPLOWO2_12_FULL_64_10]|uniref:Response regulatory domain-containing protein n=1 Tax=Handelsmanbacteria sp. (strain RIFCSPLOWO2_12_FULL_64_10) TaxID=1817868 RepID=A0A1F6C448_HANXR|nr:MAG: hypothetical protein A3F84_20525 [Candidatus Handelsmanbacteria bacterium RIFCSPLOWO2_12_FULL_64_10]
MNHPLRILLIDDNPHDRTLVIRELRREFPDLHVDQVIDAKGFDRALQTGGFDLVITDYQLHWSDGLSVLRAFKPRHPGCPVIMFTGTGSEEVAVQAMKAGLDDYVLKSPKHFVRLPAAVRSAMEDITERRRAEDTEREMERVRVLAETAGAAAHEINQPLTVLVALTEIMLMQAAPDAPQRSNLEALYKASERISRIVRNMEGVRQYATKPYAGGIDIVDFEASAGKP